jgi:hypothetical protein
MLKFWTHLNPSSLKSSYNSTKGLKASDQIVVVNITVALTAQESSVQGLLLNSWRIMGLCHSIQCWVHRQ